MWKKLTDVWISETEEKEREIRGDAESEIHSPAPSCYAVYQGGCSSGTAAHEWVGEGDGQHLISTTMPRSSVSHKDDQIKAVKYLSSYHKHGFANGWKVFL